MCASDAIILLGAACEPPPPPGTPTDEDDNFDGYPSDQLWSLVLRLRRAGVGSISFLGALRSSEAAGIATAATAARLDASVVVSLPSAGLGPSHGAHAELSLKLMLNAVSTYAMTARGLVYKNRMIGTSPTNDKIYHRCVRLIAELASVSTLDATVALLRAIHGVDQISAELLVAPTATHIIAATPHGDAQLQQQLVLPTAILLAASPASTVGFAREALREEPRVSLLLRRHFAMQSSKSEAAPWQRPTPPRPSPPLAAPTDPPPPQPMPSSPGSVTFVLGLDLGATSVKALLLRQPDGAAVGEVHREPLSSVQLDDVLAALQSAAARCCAASTILWETVTAVGLSQPGAIDAASGCVAAAANFPQWPEKTPLRQQVEAKLGVPTVMLEDSQAAMMAELVAGGAAAPPARGGSAGAPPPTATHTAAMLVLGGGVGSALAIDGKLHSGHHGLLEAGHMIIYPRGRTCACGQRGCLEAYASATAIARRAQELRQEAGVSQGQLVPADASTIFEAAKRGDDAIATTVVEEAVEALGYACLALCRIVDPSTIVLGGGLATESLVAQVTLTQP